MPLVQGVGDEVLYAALSAAAAPLAVALSPNFVRKQPLTFLQRGAASITGLLRLLWAKVRLWLVKRAQRVLCSIASKTKKQVSSREAILRRIQDFSPSSTSASVSPRSTGTCTASLILNFERREPDTREQQQLQSAAAASTDFDSDSFGSPSKKSSISRQLRAMFSGTDASSRRRESSAYPRPEASPAQAAVQGNGGMAPPEGEICSICHDDFTLPCQANCGHWFCAECILRVWHHNSALSACKCPICRRTITLLLVSEGQPPRFSHTSSTAAFQQEGVSSGGVSADATLLPARRLELLQDIAKYNRLFGGAPVSLWQRVLDMPLLLRRMGRDLVDPTRALSLLHNVRFVVCIVCVGVYVLSPLDIISESLLGLLGLVDDVVFLVCVAFYLTVLYRAVLLSRAQAFPTAD